MAATNLYFAHNQQAPQRTYWDAVTVLTEYEGPFALWRVAIGGIALALIPLAAVGALVAVAYIAPGHELPLIVLSAVAALAVPLAAAWSWKREPWARLVIDRVAKSEVANGAQDINTVIRAGDSPRAYRALRRAKLVPAGGIRLPKAAPDAPDLTIKLTIGRSNYWPHDDSRELIEQIREALQADGVRARVGGVDINPDA